MWIVAFVFVAVGLIWLVCVCEKDPQYQDKSASEWLKACRDGAVTLQRGSAAFQAMGPDGAFFLASHLWSDQFSYAKRWSDFRRKHSLPLWTQGLFPAPRDEGSGSQRRVAADLLLGLGSNAAPAFKVVWNIFQRGDDDPDNEAAITAILQSLPGKMEQFVPQLADDVRDTNRANRVDCISLLASLGSKAKAAIPALTNTAAESGSVGRSAALALWRIDRQTNVVVDILSHNLLHGNNRDKWETLRLFKDAPDVAKLVTPAIEHVLDVPNLTLQMEAENRLMDIDPTYWKTVARRSWIEPQPVVQNLLHKIVHGTDADRLLAIRKIGLLGPQAKDAVPMVVEILREWDIPVSTITDTHPVAMSTKDEVALAVVAALAEVGPRAEPATDILSVLLQHDQLHTHQYCRALGAIGPGAKRAIPTLTEMLATNRQDEHMNRQPYYMSKRLYQRLEIAGTLCLINPQATDAISILKKFCLETVPSRDTRIDIKCLCRSELILYKMGVITNPPSPRLILREISYSNEAIELLGDMGPLAKAAVPDLVRQCYHTYYGSPTPPMPEVALAIFKIDPDEADRLCLPGVLLLPDDPRN